MPDGYMFSPDSKYLAFFGTNMSARTNGLYLDGKRILDNGVARLGFSPHGKHLFVVAVNRDARTLYVDGEQAMEYTYSPFETEAHMWHVDDSGTLHFISVDQEGSKRISVTPSPDRSVDDWLAG